MIKLTHKQLKCCEGGDFMFGCLHDHCTGPISKVTIPDKNETCAKILGYGVFPNKEGICQAIKSKKNAPKLLWDTFRTFDFLNNWADCGILLDKLYSDGKILEISLAKVHIQPNIKEYIVNLFIEEYGEKDA